MTLYILRAEYGVGNRRGSFVDVTKVLRQLVTPEGLKITKVMNDTFGAGPIYKGQRKRLKVEYAVDGVKGSVVVPERHPLVLPPAAK